MPAIPSSIHPSVIIASVRLIGGDATPVWSQSAEAQTTEPPSSVPDDIAAVFEITLLGSA